MIEERSEQHQEIIIVRRHDPGHDDGHHGGVWKIAFADFMTAMMAFFLVMWLINAANEETKKAVASYFTPIKLTDKTSNPKGLNDPKYGQPSKEPDDSEDKSTFTSGGKMDHKVPDPVQVDEQALFTDPYAVLSEIAGGLVAGDARLGDQAKIEGKKDGLGTSGGEAFHDPFDPSSWNTELGLEQKRGAGEGAEVPADARNPEEGVDGGDHAARTEAPAEIQAAESQDGERLAGLGPDAAGADIRAAADPNGNTELPAKAGESDNAQDVAEDKVQTPEGVAQSLREALDELVRRRNTEGPSFEVVTEGSGVMISVADEFKFGMGSSVPRPETVESMAEIGRLLAKTPGQVIIAGHTDARKFSGGNYDNWRLSTDRAHIARYMLIRGGLDEARFERVEGFAASKPKLPDDPMAAANRRIEIHVRLP